MFKVPVIKLPGWMWAKGWAGFATPIAVFVKRREQPLIAHEMQHVRQWWRYAVIGFPAVYGYYLLKYGYWDNPLEIEARQAANDRSSD